MNRNETIAELKQIVSQIARIDVSELNDEVRVREEIGIDSLMAMEIVASCEKRFGIYVDEEQLFNIVTIGDFYNLIVKVSEEKI